MSFGGGNTQYTLEYIIKVTNQGGASGINQVNSGINQLNTGMKQTIATADQLKAAHERVVQAQLGVQKAVKGMAFGFIGIATAGAEAIGMFSMYQQTLAAVGDAQKEQQMALKESGKASKDYKDATNELTKAQRWQRMVQRNLMLSFFDLIPFITLTVNGILKYKTALKALADARAAEKALKGLGIASQGLAVSMTKSGQSITGFTPVLSKYGKGMVVAKTASVALTAEGLKTNAMFTAGEAALLKQASATNVTAAATGKLSKAMRVLGIAMKIAIPLVILEIASQAFQNNWGGFADKVNAVGKAFGDSVPQAKGFLDIIGKVGRSVAAIFTGNWDEIGKIWEEQQKAMSNTEPTEKQIKAAEKLAETLRDVAASGMDALSEIGGIEKKGERRDAMNLIGITDKDFKKYDKFVQGINKIQTTLDGFQQSIESMHTLNILQKYGIDIPDAMWKDMAKGLSKNFKALGKSLPGDDVFDQFGKLLSDASKKKGPAVMKDIFAFMAQNPNFMPMLAELRPDLYEKLNALMHGASPEMQAGLDAAISELKWDKITSDTGIKKTSFLADAILGGTGGGTTPASDTPEGTVGSIFDKVIAAIKTGITDIKTAITGANWTEIGTALREQLLKIFTPANAKWFGDQINSMVIAPMVKAFNGVFGKFAAAIQKDPIGTLMGVANMVGAPIGAFVAGLLGYKDENDMYAKWVQGLITIRDNIGVMFKGFMTDVNATIRTNLANFDISAAEGKPGSASSGNAEVDAWITKWIQPFFIPETWGRIAGNLASGKFFGDVENILNSLISFGINSQSPASANFDKNKQGSGGMSGGAGWDAWITTWIQPFFLIETWAKIAANLVSGKFFGQVEETLNSLVTFGINSHSPASANFDKNAPNSGGMSSGNEGVDKWVTTWIQPFFNLDTWKRIATNAATGLGDIGKIFGDAIKGQNVEAATVDIPIKPNPVILGKHGGPAETTGSQANEFAEGNEDASMFKVLSGWVSDQKIAPIPKEAPVQVVPKLLGPNGGDFGEDTGSQANDFASGSEDSNQLGSIISQWWNNLWSSWTPTSGSDPNGPSGGIGMPSWIKEHMILRLNLPVAVTPTLTNVSQNGKTGGDDKSGGFGTLFNLILTAAQKLQTDVTAIFNTITSAIVSNALAAAEFWSEQMTNMSAESLTTSEVVQDAFTTTNEQLEEEFNAMEENWSNAMDNMLSGGEDAVSNIQDEFTNLNEQLEEEFNAMEENWANAMDNMESDASSAASNILSDLKKLNTTFTTIHEIRTIHTGAAAKGGLLSFAKGGVISAASGLQMTTSGPTYLIGDNPGGKESIWAIPHDNPAPTVGKINTFYGKRKTDGSGSVEFNGMVQLHISGNDIINDKRLNQRIRMTVGENRDRFG